MGTRRLPAAFAIAVLAVLVVGTVVACGGGGGGGLTTYTNKDYKFSLTYDSSLLKENTAVTTKSSAGASAALRVGFVDPKGTKTDGDYRDGVVVLVYKLSQTITDSVLPSVKDYLSTTLLPQLATGYGSSATIGKLADTQLNGTKGFVTSSSFSMGGTQFKARLYFMFQGNVEYQLTMQSATSRWAELQPQLQKVIDSFKVTP